MRVGQHRGGRSHRGVVGIGDADIGIGDRDRRAVRRIVGRIAGAGFLGESGGSPTVTLITEEMPLHNHIIQGSTEDATLKVPAPTFFLGRSKAGTIYQSNSTSKLVQMNPGEFGMAGNSQPHNNMQPFLALTYIIAMQGVFPPRP